MATFAGNHPPAWAFNWSDLMSLAKIWAIISRNFETVQDRTKLVLITNRKSHIGFRLVPKSVTLNGVIAIILGYFAEFGSFVANYITVVD